MKLNYDKVKDYKFEYTLACECGDGVDKSLEAIVKAGFVEYLVNSHDNILIQTKSLREAVRTFNEAK